jgi:chromosome segregation ATPase
MLTAMRTVWSERDEGGLASASHRAAARAAKVKYQRKEAELQDEQTALTKLNAGLREKKEEHSRLRRETERHQLEGIRLEDRERQIARDLDDLEKKITDQKSRVSRLEHDVETLREEAFRGQRFGV